MRQIFCVAAIAAMSGVAGDAAARTTTDGFSAAVSSTGSSIVCYVFDDGHTNMAGPSDAIYIRGPESACIPGGPNGVCRKWLGRCVTSDSASLPVMLRGFNDGYTNPSAPADAVFIDGIGRACTPGGPTGICHKWFGPDGAARARFYLFSDGYTAMIGPTDAIYSHGDRLCMPGGLDGICRKWFGRG